MQSDLISRRRLKSSINREDGIVVGGYRYIRAAAVMAKIDAAPKLDAVPVVHGRWFTSSDIPDTLICSVCGRRFDMYHFDQKDMPFCLCGAKMDGGNVNG